MTFIQDPPRVGNMYSLDRMLRSFLARHVPEDARREIEPELAEMGELAATTLADLAVRHRRDEPELVQWDPWGNRIDEIRVPQMWTELGRAAAEKGVVATAYERRHGEHSRVHQFGLAYLFERSSFTYNCPLAMTDGAARILTTLAEPSLRDRVLPRLLSRDPETMWTAGQWMTERTGGSDVGLSETVAKQSPEGWRLYGTKWFTSSITSQMAMTLGRPEGNPAGGRGLALFYLEVRAPDGSLNDITIHRLKEKLGTRMLPTAELTLDGAIAIPVCGLTNGVRNITPLLNATRTWNAISSVAAMQKGVTLARDYADRRFAFGAKLSEKPLHTDTLAAMQAELEGAFHLVFHTVRLVGREDAGTATDAERATLRLLYPIAKLLTARQAVACASETLEAFGGAGYVEDTGLPALLRDAQTLSIWEGTTNVLSLDALRAIAKEQALRPFLEGLRTAARQAHQPEVRAPAEAALRAADRASAWLAETAPKGTAEVEAGARRFAMTLGRAMSLALLTSHASWALENEGDPRPALAARRYAAAGVDLLDSSGLSLEEAASLAMDR